MADDNVKKLVVNSNTADTPEPEVEDPFDDIKKEMRTRYELLPEEVKTTIMDDGYQMKLFNIAKAQKLTYEELGTVEMETTMVLLGMIAPVDYRDELQVQLKKNDAEIDAVVKEVNVQVFDPIRASLQKIYDAKKDSADFLPQTQQIEEREKEEALKNPPSAATPSATTNTTPAVAPTLSSWKAQTPATPAPALSKEDTNVLGKAGVIISETPSIKIDTELPALNRNELLASIENPAKSQPVNLVANKLTEDKPIMQAKTTDYSIVKPVPTTTTPAPVSTTPKTDPYREKV